MSRYPWEEPLGARPLSGGGTRFRVWAPSADPEPQLVLWSGAGAGSRSGASSGSVPARVSRRPSDVLPLEHVRYGIYQLDTPVEPGTDYSYLISGRRHPDPASRWQPAGLRGPSRVYEPAPYAPFEPRPLTEQVIYELHIGTFSPEGTFAGAVPYLPGLAELGVTAIEVMPVAEFPGARGWGYDGVYISAAQSSYGGPAGFQELVAGAHACGLAVILDVVYNHVGASGGKALEAFGPYFTGKYDTPWGRAMNYDDADCDPVREWVLQSAEGWVRDFGVDGLRLDAIHAIFDSSPEHLVAAVARRVHALGAGKLVIAESGLNDPLVMRPGQIGGYGCDAAWADDFHHALRTLITDEHDGYYADFGRVAQLAKAFQRPFVDDGGYSPFRRRRFGAPAGDVPVQRFVVFCQDHDQVGNRAFGDRLPREARPLAAFCTLLAPFTPMLFMGEEYGEDAPFQFFCDHIDKRIAEATRNGRRAEFAAFASFGHEIPDPQAVETFLASKLTRQGDPALVALYAELLRVRRELPRQVGPVTLNEDERWLRLARGGHAADGFELVANFADAPRDFPTQGHTVLRLATHPEVELAGGTLRLPGLAGALLSGVDPAGLSGARAGAEYGA